MKRSAPNISFHFQMPCTLSDRTKLRSAISNAFKLYDTRLSALSIIFCSDAFLLDINRKYLKHDYYTDIITFDLADPGSPVEGEIYISIDRIRENARLENVPVNHELHRVIFHGVLHLCGFTDHSPKEKAKMTASENSLLAKYFVPRGNKK